MQNIRPHTLSRSCLAFLRPLIYALTFFHMKGVTEIHISCAFHEHSNTVTVNGYGCYGFYDSITFKKLQTVRKLEI